MSGFTSLSNKISIGPGLLVLGNPKIQVKQLGDLYADYLFYVDFADGMGRDRVSKQPLTTVLDAGRFDYDGNEYAENIPVINDGMLLTNGAYSQLVPKSEDTSVWAGSGPWTKVITLADTGTYTLSTDLSGAIVTTTAGTATITAEASATFGNADQFEVTVVGTVTITTDKADPKVQVTKTAYKMPYAINTTTGTLSVPLNYSDATHGYKYPIGDGSVCGDNLLDAFDGAADGTVALDDDFSTDTTASYSDASSGVITYNDVGKSLLMTYSIVVADRGIYRSAIVISGKYYDVQFRAKSNKPTSFSSIINAGSVGTAIKSPTLATTYQHYHFRVLATQTAMRLYLSSVINGTTLEIDDLLIQEISSAQGRLTRSWMPTFAAADVTGQISILTVNGTAIALLYYDADTNQIKAFDGVNTAVVACTPVNGTLYQIVLDWGDNVGQKMRLMVDSTVGTPVTHAGSFPVTEDMSVAWIATAPQRVGAIKIKKEPNWDEPFGDPPAGYAWLTELGEYQIDGDGNFIYALI